MTSEKVLYIHLQFHCFTVVKIADAQNNQ